MLSFFLTLVDFGSSFKMIGFNKNYKNTEFYFILVAIVSHFFVFSNYHSAARKFCKLNLAWEATWC